MALILAAWLQWEGGAALKSELPQSITLAESPYGCMDSKVEAAHTKDGRFYAFARDASIDVFKTRHLACEVGPRSGCNSRICGLPTCSCCSTHRCD